MNHINSLLKKLEKLECPDECELTALELFKGNPDDLKDDENITGKMIQKKYDGYYYQEIVDGDTFKVYKLDNLTNIPSTFYDLNYYYLWDDSDIIEKGIINDGVIDITI
jgi:hypothetical protein